MLEEIIASIPSWSKSHNRETKIYQLIDKLTKAEVVKRFSSKKGEMQPFAPFGTLSLPYFQMGEISSLDLFGLDELMIFSVYQKNNYKKALDLGANIGLHSIVLAKLGVEVTAYEPDPLHYAELCENLKRNKVTTVVAEQKAISSCSGRKNFTRVAGNTTSSHLTGSKIPYGNLEFFDVEVVDIKEIVEGVDVIKMDIEGHETEVLKALSPCHFAHTDWILEVSTEESRKQLYPILCSLKVGAFSQKKNWQKVTCEADLPATHREGSLFLSSKLNGPWG